MRRKLDGFLAQSVINIDSYQHHNFANYVFHPDNGSKQNIDSLLQDPSGQTWTTFISNELGRLSEGIGKIAQKNHISIELTRCYSSVDHMYLSIPKSSILT